MNQETIQPNEFEKVVMDTKSDILKVDENNSPKKRGRKSKTESNTVAPVATKPNPSDYEAPLKSLFLFSGVMLSTGFKFEGFKISEEEANLLAKQGAEVAVEFAPVINSKYAKLGAFTIAIASVYGVKAFAYSQYMNSLEVSKNLSENKPHEVQQN